MKCRRDHALKQRDQAREKIEKYIAEFQQAENELQMLKNTNATMCPCRQMELLVNKPTSTIEQKREQIDNFEQQLSPELFAERQRRKQEYQDSDYWQTDLGLMDKQRDKADMEKDQANEEMYKQQAKLRRVQRNIRILRTANERLCFCNRRTKRRRCEPQTSENK